MENRFEFALELIESLEKKGIFLWAEGDKIKYKANAGALQKADIAQLKEYKAELLELLDSGNKNITLVENKAERYEPFVLTDVQQSYLMGRSNLFDYGGTACHIYLQLNYTELNPARVEEVWNYLIEKHEMLRTVIYEDGYQQIMEHAPHFKVTDYKNLPANEIQEKMGHKKYEIGKFPYFGVGVSNYEDGAIMHFSIEFIIADWTSIWTLLLQFEQLYFNENAEIEDVKVSFRDYVIAERELKASAVYERDKKYWLDKLETFPTRPLIDVNRFNPNEEVRFERKFLQFSVEEWTAIKQNAVANAITPTALMLMVYAAVLERYSENKRFALNLTVLNRQPFHEDINKVIGDFTTLTLLDVDFDNNNTFIENARNANSKLFEDLDHNVYSGVSFMRELSRKKGTDASFMPYVFTSAIGLLSSMGAETVKGMVTGIGISQTPQVFIDCQVMDGSFGMQVNWDIRQGVFKDDVIEGMFSMFKEILNALANGVDVNEATAQNYSKYQQAIFENANATTEQLSEHLIHERILSTAQNNPDKTAVIVGDKKYSYGELVDISSSIYNELKKNGRYEGELIGIAAKKSVYQPASALAILSLGGVYVPISVEQGKKRIENILKRAEIKKILTDSDDETEYPQDVLVIRVDSLEKENSKLPNNFSQSLDSLAYIIFTSGSTGEPKGVAITHRAVVNTIEDINKRYCVNENDSVLGVSQLNFDLSVYDIFGLLSVGGTLVYPEENHKKDPSYLAKLISENNITIWNSVPSLLQMVTVYLDFENEKTDISSLRLALLSGDWIPLDLPDKIISYSANVKVVSLGGATEASIWSIYHDYNGLCEEFASIPYGKPLANQQFRILDKNLRDCPIGVKGDIYILGKGLALGYYNDPEKTTAQFIKDPKSGVMMYKTGDIGKYHMNGEIEFLGRSDSQIKLNGHRIELGEIESAVNQTPHIKKNSVIYADSDKEKAIVCFYETDFTDELQRNAGYEKFKLLTENVDKNAKKLMEGLDTYKLENALETENNALKVSMLKSLYVCAGEKAEFTLSDILNSGKIIEKHKWLVVYWINLLKNTNYLQQNGDVYKIPEVFINAIEETEIKTLWSELKNIWIDEMGSEDFFNYLYQSAISLNSLLDGNTDPIKLLYPDGKTSIVSDMYVNNKMSKYLNICICDFVKSYSQNHKNVRILEIGAGTCATSLQVTKALGDKDYIYYVTDINKHFIPSAESKFDGNPNMRFSVLDIDGDIIEQGFDENSFDIVIAVGVLENTKDIKESLRQVRRLVRPSGYFLFTEPVREEAWILASQGFLMTKPQDDIRKEKAFLNTSEWNEILDKMDSFTKTLTFPSERDRLKLFGLDLYIKQFKVDKNNVTSENIVCSIKENLTSYMVPSVFCMLDSIPVTDNGKTDVKYLKSIAEKRNGSLLNVSETSVLDSGFSELQKQIFDSLKESGIRVSGLTDNFYDFGADSLIMAQTTGNLREKIASDIPFDELLRFMLNNPTIKELSEFIDKRQSGQSSDANSGNQNESIGAVQLYEAGEGVLRVVFHAAFGTMNALRYVVDYLIKQNKGTVMTIALGDADRYYNMDKETAVQQLADDYTKLILQTGAKQVQLVGYCFGGWLATQCANRLVEQGIEIADIILVDSQTVPWVIEDRMFIEMMFLPNFGISISDLDISDSSDMKSLDMEGMFNYLIKEYGEIPEGVADILENVEEYSKLAKSMKKLMQIPQNERFKLYAEISEQKTGEAVDPSILEGVFKPYCQTIRCANGEMEAYVGDIRFLSAKESGDMFYSAEKNISYWSELCIGELAVTEINGNHYTCVENPEYAADVCEIIGDF